MDASYYECFRKAIDAVFAMMIQAEVQIEQPAMIDAGKTRFDVSGMIGISGGVTGAMVIGFDSKTAGHLIERLTGENIEPTQPDFSDAVGELANMIAGYAKARFKHVEASITCPTVIVNEQHKIYRPKGTDTVRIRCHCELGMFDVEVTMKNSVATRAVA